MLELARAFYGRILRAVSRRVTFEPFAKANARIDDLQAHLKLQTAPPLWLHPNYTEPRVQYAMHDMVRSGQVVFDVGSNFGGLTVALSRLVGPRGVVCAFEANPVTATKCQQQLVLSGAVNTHVYQGAIYRRSGKNIDFYLSDNQVADSIYRETKNKISVHTIALDDFVSRFQLVPDLVKMDIEGAEADALLGFERTIDAYHPTLILEHTPSDSFCLDFLLAKGYRAIDLQNYRRVRCSDDIPDGTAVTDLLYATPDRLVRTPYGGDLLPEKVVELSAEDFQWTDSNHQWSTPLMLKPGRYLATLSLTAEGGADAMCGVWDDRTDEAIMRVHALSRSLPNFAHRIVFDFAGGPARMFVHFTRDSDPSFKFEQVEIWRVPAFEAFRTPRLASR